MMFGVSLAYATMGLYLLASGAFLAYPLWRGERILRAARWLLIVAVICHFATIGQACLKGLNPLLDAAGVLNLMAFFVALGYLLTGLKWRIGAAGAIVAPLAFALVVSAQLTPRGADTVPSSHVVKLLGQAHLTLVALGVAAFALAAAVALLYLLQDAALRANRLGALYRRTPPLATLDLLGQRLIFAGFPIFTLAVISGLLWMTRIPGRAGGFRIEYALSGGIWLVFGGLILARVTVGVGGRRAAALTLVGFVATAVVLLLYVGRRMAG